MTQEEKDEFNKRRTDRLAKDNKTRIIWAIILPVVGVVLSVAIGFAGKSKQGEIASATVLDTQSVGEFLNENGNGTAVYTGTASAADPVSLRDEDGEYIRISRKIEEEFKVRDNETDKVDTETNLVSDDFECCDEITLDDVTIPYSVFHDLPSGTDTNNDKRGDYNIKTTYSFIPASVDGTFLIKAASGEIVSAEYYKSNDIAGESSKVFSLAIVLIWIVIIAIEVFLIIKTVRIAKVLGVSKRSLGVFAAVILAAGMLAGCKAEPDPNSGLYKAVSAQMMGMSMGVEEIYENGVSFELKDGGKCVADLDGETFNIKWSTEGNRVHIEGRGVDLSGTIGGGEMILENMMDMGLDMTFHCDELTHADLTAGGKSSDKDKPSDKEKSSASAASSGSVLERLKDAKNGVDVYGPSSGSQKSDDDWGDLWNTDDWNIDDWNVEDWDLEESK